MAPTLESRSPRRARAAAPPPVPAAASSRTPEVQASALRQTRHSHALETAEDYVEAIADLTHTLGEARAVDLARRLGVSHVTVIRTVARLQRDGYVSRRPYRALFLTGKGARLARSARERHELVVAYLHSLGIPDHVAQSDAEGIEHHVSAETLAAFRRHIAAPRRAPADRAPARPRGTRR